MKQAAAHTTTKSPRGNNPVILSTLGKDLADTAWRIAVPVILAAIIGIVLDKNIGTAPWFTLALTVVGFILAGLLVKKQLAAVEKREDKS
ncbi:MAG TPA: AtpZ/AtpI family protein [Candidatus Saccharimonadales bacterium]|nr:AtpZ/AtpI family protein [Candidatus Saccharimonadales bacterium]